jgi:hypothetical protein
LPQFGFVLISDLVDQIFNESFFRFSRGNLKISLTMARGRPVNCPEVDQSPGANGAADHKLLGFVDFEFYPSAAASAAFVN